MAAITYKFDIMALTESSMLPAHRELDKFEGYDNLFDQLIESDSFRLGDSAAAADRAGPDSWANFLDLPDSCSGTTDTRSPNRRMQVLEIPHRERKLDATAPTDTGRIVSLADLDSIHNPTQPHPSALFHRRNIARSGAKTASLGHRSGSVGVYKSTRMPSTSPTMSSRQQSRRQSSDKGKQKATQSSSESESSRARQRPLTAAPTSAPMTQTVWAPSQPHYPPYGHEPGSSSGAPNQLAFRQSSFSTVPQAYEQQGYSPLSTPHGEHSGGEEMSSYFHTPGTPYFTDADPLAPQQDYGSYSTLPSARGYPFEGSPYGQEQHEFTASQPWWSASAAQPYGPNPAFAPATQQAEQHATPTPADQSGFDAVSGGLTIKRDADAPGPNFSNTGASRIQDPPHDTPPANLGHRKIRQEQFAESHRRSSSPSMASQSSRKSSSSGRPGGLPQRRTKTAGPSTRRESPSSAFVNMTPEDGPRILTGVAPSGSSKTKARREKEAAEKQRKLSRAAAKAILDAGGTLETLERQGLWTEKEDEQDEEGSSS